jgi:hypothetical protein
MRHLLVLSKLVSVLVLPKTVVKKLFLTWFYFVLYIHRLHPSWLILEQ